MERAKAKGEKPKGAEAPERSDKLHKPEGGTREPWRVPCAAKRTPEGGVGR
jgi:hypothetical protein